jgi:peroxiredoxin
MKKFICLLAFTGIIATCAAQKPHYEITVKIDGAEGVTFTLQKSLTGKIIYLDTAIIVNGMFIIIGGSVEYPEMVSFVTLDKKKGLSFYLENSNITITGKLDSLGNAIITGSKTQDEFHSLTASIKSLGDKYTGKNKEYQSASKASDTPGMIELGKQIDTIIREIKAIQKEFVINNPASFAAPPVLRSLINDIKTSEMESIINAMDPNVAKTQIIVDLKARIIALKAVDIGQKAPDFTMNDVNGNPIALSSKIGPKLLLIDFWAAWCGPCRNENPNVVKVYKEFHEKGFDILGVSLDRNKADWIKAIADDNLTWTHVSDIQYWNNAAAKLYAVNSIPANFLLDKNGIIVAKNIRGEALYNTVKELLNTK